MAVRWKCDVCGKETMLNPPVRPVLEPVVDEKGKPVLEGGKPKMRAKMTTQKYQHPVTGAIVDAPVPLTEDEFPRAYLVRLGVGQETVQRDVCKEHLDELMEKIRPLWDALAGMEPK